jgi:zona occludens toxin
MLHVITGGNGSGKTLLTLKLVKERAERENRPVCHNGRFEIIPGGPLSSWRQIDFKDWQAEPDGTIFFIDECHNDLPLRGSAEKVPEAVRMLAEHRRRGFDFYLITQHPQNMDMFVRRLVSNPGWHRHLKRTAGAELVSVLQWNAVNPNCEKDGSGRTGEVTMVPYPKEVYSWYKSAQLHTGQRKIPRAVWVLGACALAVPALGYFGFRTVVDNVTGKATLISQAKPGAAGPGGAPVGQGGHARSSPDGPRPPMTPAEYAEMHVPRVPGLAWTAPKYDQITQPVTAPYPAACVESKTRCVCYTQQATQLQVAADVCQQMARNGFFMDWKADAGREPVRERAQVHAAVARAPDPAPAVLGSGEAVGTLGRELLSSPASGDSAPKFFPAVLESTHKDGRRWEPAGGGSLTTR